MEEMFKLDITVIGEEIGLPPTPSGIPHWKPENIPQVMDYVSRLGLPPGTKIKIGGRGPIWLYVMLMHLFHPSRVYIEDPKLEQGMVEITQLRVGDPDMSRHVSWEIEEHLTEIDGHRVMLQIYSMILQKPVLSVEDLREIVVPVPQPGEKGMIKGVVLYGRGPIWLYACVASTIMHMTAFVAVGQPGLIGEGKPGAVVVITHSEKIKPGTVFPLPA